MGKSDCGQPEHAFRELRVLVCGLLVGEITRTVYNSMTLNNPSDSIATQISQSTAQCSVNFVD